jgi:hypothetical protein
MSLSIFIFTIVCSIIFILGAYWLGKEQMAQEIDKLELQYAQELLEHRERWAAEIVRHQYETNQIIARHHKSLGKPFTVIEGRVDKNTQTDDLDLRFINENYYR